MDDILIAMLCERASDPKLATDMSSKFPQLAPRPVDETSVSKAVTALGRALPVLLRDLYRLVGDGGFGPGYGLLPLLEHSGPDQIDSVVSLYSALSATDPEDPTWAWPAALVPFCEWGCAIRSCVDCSTRDGAVVTFDPGARDAGEDMSAAVALTHPSLRSWLLDWLNGVKIWELMFEPDPSRARTGINPFTKEPLTLVPNKLRRP